MGGWVSKGSYSLLSIGSLLVQEDDASIKLTDEDVDDASITLYDEDVDDAYIMLQLEVLDDLEDGGEVAC